MTQTRYVAKKVGDRYQLQEQSAQHTAISTGWAVGGGLVALLGISRRSVPGALLALAGGAMVYHGITGQSPMRLIERLWPRRDEGSASETPSFQHDEDRQVGQIPQNEVEEASMESFPASDPPAFTRTEAGR